MLQIVCFFFQAEDGRRDVAVTGVQTCALPIWKRERERERKKAREREREREKEREREREREMRKKIKFFLSPCVFTERRMI